MDKIAATRFATILLPIFCLCLSGGLFTYEKSRLSGLRAEYKSTEQQIKSLEKLLKDMEGQKQTLRYPTVDQSPDEQPTFLNNLRAAADSVHVDIAKFSNTVQVLTGTAALMAKKAPQDAMPLSSNLEVQGNYAQIRRFLYCLLRSPRLLTLSEMRWSRGIKGAKSTVTFTLTRYVAPPGKGSKAVRAAAGGEKASNASFGEFIPVKTGMLYRPNADMTDKINIINPSAVSPTTR